MDDNRVFARMKARFPLRYLDPVSGKEGEAETVDISANGLGLVTRSNLGPNTSLEMWLRIPDQHAPLYARGAVVWSKPSGSPVQTRLGVKLEKAELMGLARILWLRRGA